MTILKVPDSRLREVCAPCPGLSGELTKQLFMLLKSEGGVGLAGPQIGVMQRFFVLGNGFLCVNPRITPYGTQIDVVEYSRSKLQGKAMELCSLRDRFLYAEL